VPNGRFRLTAGMQQQAKRQLGFRIGAERRRQRRDLGACFLRVAPVQQSLDEIEAGAYVPG
jgi:hypothetical protein